MAAMRRTGRTKVEQREETVRALVAEARRLFSAHGYAKVSLAEVAEASGVTKGALYHHFSGKPHLFRAVLEDVHADVADRVAGAAAPGDAWDQLLAGCRTFLAASTEPGIQQIMLIDAPSVLGWGAWREIDAATSMQHLEDILSVLMDEGVIQRQPLAPLVHLLSGAMNEAALWLARSDDLQQDLEDTMAALSGLLGALRVAGESRGAPAGD